MSKIAVQSGLVTLFTAMGVILGYARDAIIAAWFGSSSATDAYFVAFMIPSTLNQVVITGTLVPAFLPVFVEYLNAGRHSEGWHIASSVANTLLVLLGILVGLGMVGAYVLARFLAPAFSTETTSLVVVLMRIMFPAVAAIGLAGLASGVLNSLDHFAAPVFSSAASSLVMILSFLVLAPSMGIYGLAIATMLGMVAQVAVQLPELARSGVRYSLVFDLQHPGVRKILRLSGPLFLFVALAQTSPVVERIFGSTLPSGTIANLSFAMKINVMPNILFAASLAIVLYPTLSRHAAIRDLSALRQTIGRGITTTLFFAVPSAVWLILAGGPLIRLLFEHGRFTPDDSMATLTFLRAYALGIIPASLGGLLIRSFYSLQDSLTPLISGIATTFCYVILSYLLMSIWQATGLALSLSITSGISTLTLLWLLRRKIGPITTGMIWQALIKMALAAGLMGMASLIWLQLFDQSLTNSIIGRAIQIGSLGILSAVVYCVACYVLQVEEVHSVRSLLRLGRVRA